MSPTPATNLFKSVRPAVGRVGLNTIGTSLPKQRVKYSMRHAKNKNIQVSDASMTDKALRKQLHRRQPPASVSARRDDIRQQDMLRRRANHFSVDSRLPSFARAGKSSKFTSVSDRLAIVLACEARVREVMMLELNAASPDINTALHAAVKIQQDFGLFNGIGSVTDIFVACLRKVGPAIFELEHHTLYADRDWDYFWSVYRYLTTEAEWGRLRDELYNLYKVLENVDAFSKLKISVETSVSTEKFDGLMDLSAYFSCGPESVAAWRASPTAQTTSTQSMDADSDMIDYDIPACASTPAVTYNGTLATQSMTDIDMLDLPPPASSSMTPTIPSSVMSASNAAPIPDPAPPSVAAPSPNEFTSLGLDPNDPLPAQAPLATVPPAATSQLPVPAQPSAAKAHSATNFMTCKSRPVQTSSAQASPAQVSSAASQPATTTKPAAASHSNTQWKSFGGPPPR